MSPIEYVQYSQEKGENTSDILTEDIASIEDNNVNFDTITTRSIGPISTNPEANGAYTWTGDITKKIEKHQKVWLSGDASRTGAKGVFIL